MLDQNQLSEIYQLVHPRRIVQKGFYLYWKNVYILVRSHYDNFYRSSAGATLSSATRSLPDLPVETPRGSDAVATTVWYGVDTNSELYATVEENKNNIKRDSSKYVNNTMSPSSGTTASKSECVYASVNKENPYDKLKQEHPYAKVGMTSPNNQYTSSQG